MAVADYTNELWKTIDAAPDYAVSDHGRVMRVTDGTGLASMAKAGRILRPSKSSQRKCYHHVQLGAGCSRLVHRLVATAFIGPEPFPAAVVAHNDGNGLNNHISNLRWSTQADNLADRVKHGTDDRGSKSKCAKLTDEQVAEIRASTASQSALGRRFGVSQTTIWKVKARQRYS